MTAQPLSRERGVVARREPLANRLPGTEKNSVRRGGPYVWFSLVGFPPPRRIILKKYEFIAPEPVTIHMQHKTNARQRRSPAHRTASIEIGLEQYTHSPKRRLKDCCVEGSACSHSARHAWWKGLAQPSHATLGGSPSRRYS